MTVTLDNRVKTRDKVKRRRIAKGWTQQELADEAGLSVSAVGMIESGRRPNPHPHTLRRLAGALGCDILDLLDDPPGGP